MESEPPMGCPGTGLQGLACEVGEGGETAVLMLLGLLHVSKLVCLGHHEARLNATEASKRNQPPPGQDVERLPTGKIRSGFLPLQTAFGAW
jgi:hypothetical protein